MSDNTGIEWADATWNVVIGCDKVSPGCDNCYAIRTATRMSANPNPKISTAYAGTAAAGEWTGQINMLPDRLILPYHWARPRKIFVNAQSDLFHADVTDEFIAAVFAVMACTPQHTYQILTKRPARMRSLMQSELFREMIFTREAGQGPMAHILEPEGWPLPNVWLGVSVEDQKRADLRIPALLETPAAVRWISAEPLLGPITLAGDDTRSPYWLTGEPAWAEPAPVGPHGILMSDLIMKPGLDWVVVGGESGPKARPMHPAWARQLRNQCAVAGVPFLFKQWGEWVSAGRPSDTWWDKEPQYYVSPIDGRCVTEQEAIDDGGPFTGVYRVGKKAAGRELDGELCDQYPKATS
jgi:protein gp37